MSFLLIPIQTYPNTALGYEALTNVVIAPPFSGQNNTAFGDNALKQNTTGYQNVAFGRAALLNNTTGNNNTVAGMNAAAFNITGSANTAFGAQAFWIGTGDNNTAIGAAALASVTTGIGNTGVGDNAGSAITTGSRNSILGRYTGNQGGLDIRTLSNYIVLSDGAGNPRLWINDTGAVNIPGGLALTGSLSITGGTVTANNPVLSATQTWNNAAVTFTGWQLNVTDTASNAASLLMDLQRGGASQFAIYKDGAINIGGIGSANVYVQNAFNGTMKLHASYFIGWQNGAASPGTSSALSLSKSSSDALIVASNGHLIEQRNGVSAQTLRVYNTFTDASNYERGRFAWVSNVLTIGTENAGTGLARALDIQTGGTSRILVDTSGRVSVGTASAFDRLTVQNFSGVSGGIFVLGATADGNWGGGITLANYLGTIYGSINAATSGVNIGSSALSSGVFIRTAGSGDTSAVFDNNKNVVLNSAAIATNATNGFLYVAGCAGAPTGTPTAYTGRVPIVVDTTNNKLYFYSGGAWRDAGP